MKPKFSQISEKVIDALKKKQRSGQTLLHFIHSIMNIIWIYSLSLFSTSYLSSKPFPLVSSALVFFMALGIAHWTENQGKLKLWRYTSQIIGLLVSVLFLVHIVMNVDSANWQPSWIITLWQQPKSAQEWTLLILSIIWSTAFWRSGTAATRRSISYNDSCMLFDKGTAVFGCIFLALLILKVKTDWISHGSTYILLFLSFFIFGLAAIALSNNQAPENSQRKSGFPVLMSSISFIAIVLVLGLGITTLFMSQLTLAADSGYRFLKNTVEPLGPILISLLRFILGYHRTNQENISLPIDRSTNSNVQDALNGEIGWIDSIFMMVLAGAGLLILIITGFFLFMFLSRKVLNRSQSKKIAPRIFVRLRFWIKQLSYLIGKWFRNAFTQNPNVSHALFYYLRLLKWGRYCSIKARKTETPYEYGQRICRAFPSLTSDIMTIIHALHFELYGGKHLETRQLKNLQKAWIKMCRPKLWPARLKHHFWASRDEWNNF